MVNIFFVDNLNISYPKKNIISNLSFSVKSGEILSIMGPNGGGKTTLLNSLIGRHGGVTGQWGWRQFDKIVPLVPQEWAYLPQRVDFDRTFPLTVQQVVAMGMKTFSKSRLEEALDKVRLRDYAAKPISHLSGGQIQRMFFARIFVQEASLILLDEPFAGVDDLVVEDLLKLIFHWREQGKIILLTQHNRLRALQYFPQTLLLAHNFYRWGKSEEVLSMEQWVTVHEKIHAPQCC